MGGRTVAALPDQGADTALAPLGDGMAAALDEDLSTRGEAGATSAAAAGGVGPLCCRPVEPRGGDILEH